MGRSLKGKELGKGITQRKDGRYQARYIDRSGKRKTIYADTQKEINKKLHEAQLMDARYNNVTDNNITLDQWFDIYIKVYKADIKDTSKRAYTIQYNRMRGALGECRLDKLNALMIQSVLNDLPSDRARKDCKALLVNMLNYAIESDLMRKNPAANLKTRIDGRPQKEKRILSHEEVELLYAYSKKNNSPLYPIFIIGFNTGMRIGEILGLCWDCVDFDKGFICVRRGLCYLPNNGDAIYEFHEPKTASGRRIIPMTNLVKNVLLEQRQTHDKIASKFRAKEGFEDLVFVSRTNRPLHGNNITSSIKCMVNNINREYPDVHMEYFSPHSMRHTFATDCIEKGMNPKVLQKLLGHSSYQMTMDLYCHVREDVLIESMMLLDM